MNTYGYVGGNPVNGIDPYGLMMPSSQLLRTILNEATTTAIQNQVENEIGISYKKKIDGIRRQIELLNNSINFNNEIKFDCLLGCMNRRDESRCFDFDQCTDNCLDLYRRQENELLKLKMKYEMLLPENFNIQDLFK